MIKSADAKEHFLKGELLLDKEDWDGAIKEYTEAIRLDPNYTIAYTARGLVYWRKGDRDRSYADSAEAERLTPPSDGSFVIGEYF